MNRVLLALGALSLIALTAPVQGVAQTDWAITVPLEVTSLSSDVTAGAVVCYVTSDDDAAGALTKANDLPRLLSETEAGGLVSPGQPIAEFAGIQVAGGEFVGYTTFPLDAEGNGPASVTVSIIAPSTATDAQKGLARNYVCALGLRVAPGGNEWFSVVPEKAQASGFADALAPQEGTNVSGVKIGALPGGS